MVLNQTDVNSIRTLYLQSIQKLVEGCYYFPVDFENQMITQFEFKGETYCLPKSKMIQGHDVPMVDVTALEFAESADLLLAASQVNGKDFTKLPLLIAVLCRPEGEPYDENKALERAELFKDLTMDVYWNVFFSLLVPLNIFLQCAQISSLKEAIQNPVI